MKSLFLKMLLRKVVITIYSSEEYGDDLLTVGFGELIPVSLSKVKINSKGLPYDGMEVSVDHDEYLFLEGALYPCKLKNGEVVLILKWLPYV